MSVIVERRGNRTTTRRQRSALEILVTGPGGISRERAIAEANRNVEAMRDVSMDAIQTLIDTLEEVSARAGMLEVERLGAVRKIAGQIVTLSETFGLTFLAEAAKRVCDLIFAFEDGTEFDPAILAIPVHAVHIFGPRQEPQSAATARAMLSELRALLRHLGVAMPDAVADL